jgi:hypothetical protein
MKEKYSAMDRLKSLGDFSDPTGLAAQVQSSCLEQEIRRMANESPDLKFRMTEDGPEQTAAEILVELDEEERMIAALREAVENAGRATD